MTAVLDPRQKLILLVVLALVSAAVAGSQLAAHAAWVRFFDNLHWTLGYAGGTLIIAQAWSRAQGADKERLACFGLGLGLYTVGQLLWDLQVYSGWNPFPGPSDLFFLLLGPGFTFGFLHSLRGQSPKARLAIALDLGAIAAASLAFSLALYLPGRGESSWLVTATMAAYPVALVTALGALLIAALAHRWRPHWSLLLLAFALGLQVWLWLHWNLLSLNGTLQDGMAFSALFSFGAVLLGLASALWRPTVHDSPRAERSYFFLWSSLPVVLAVGAGLSLSMAGNLSPVVAAWVQACALIVVLCTVARQSLVVIEREDRRQAEAQARASEERLRALTEARVDSQRLEALGTLAGGVAHEFNNILMAVTSQLDLAEPAVRDPEANEAIRLARSATHRGRDVIRRILAFARKDAPDIERARIVPLASLLEEVQRLLKPLLPAWVRLELEDHSPGAQVQVDPVQLHQVLVNLGLNGGQALGRQPGSVRFVLEARYLGLDEGLPEGEYAEISIIDDGPGMDESVRRRIFEPFFTTKGPESGNGLGLAVVHGLVTGMGGSISCESAPGQGAHFRILLPRAGVSTAAAKPAPGPAAPRAAGLEIMVLDDEAMIARGLQRLLQRAGHQALAVSDPFEALDLLRRQPGRFALLITDMSMPGLNGHGVLREARALDPALKVILSTGSVARDGDDAGFDAWLEKPYALDQLLEAIARVAPR